MFFFVCDLKKKDMQTTYIYMENIEVATLMTKTKCEQKSEKNKKNNQTFPNVPFVRSQPVYLTSAESPTSRPPPSPRERSCWTNSVRVPELALAKAICADWQTIINVCIEKMSKSYINSDFYQVYPSFIPIPLIP
jgi:hypothetical protein